MIITAPDSHRSLSENIYFYQEDIKYIRVGEIVPFYVTLPQPHTTKHITSIYHVEGNIRKVYNSLHKESGEGGSYEATIISGGGFFFGSSS